MKSVNPLHALLIRLRAAILNHFEWNRTTRSTMSALSLLEKKIILWHLPKYATISALSLRKEKRGHMVISPPINSSSPLLAIKKTVA